MPETTPDPPPPTFTHVDPTGRRLHVCPARYRGEPGVSFQADGVTLTLPVLAELVARLPVIVADAQAFADALTAPLPTKDGLPVSTCPRTDRHGYHLWADVDRTAICPGHPAPPPVDVAAAMTGDTPAEEDDQPAPCKACGEPWHKRHTCAGRCQQGARLIPWADSVGVENLGPEPDRRPLRGRVSVVRATTRTTPDNPPTSTDTPDNPDDDRYNHLEATIRTVERVRDGVIRHRDRLAARAEELAGRLLGAENQIADLRRLTRRQVDTIHGIAVERERAEATVARVQQLLDEPRGLIERARLRAALDGAAPAAAEPGPAEAQPTCAATLNHPDDGLIHCDQDHGGWRIPTLHCGPIPGAESPAANRRSWRDTDPGATAHTDTPKETP